MTILLGLIVFGIFIYLASQRQKEDARRHVTNVGEEMLIFFNYHFDLALASHDALKNNHSIRDYMVFKKKVLDNEQILAVCENQAYLCRERQNEEGYEDFMGISEDLKRIKEKVRRAHSIEEAFPDFNELEQLLGARIITRTREEIIKDWNDTINTFHAEVQSRKNEI